jgi:hypothetical protein
LGEIQAKTNKLTKILTHATDSSDFSVSSSQSVFTHFSEFINSGKLLSFSYFVHFVHCHYQKSHTVIYLYNYVRSDRDIDYIVMEWKQAVIHLKRGRLKNEKEPIVHGCYQTLPSGHSLCLPLLLPHVNNSVAHCAFYSENFFFIHYP